MNIDFEAGIIVIAGIGLLVVVMFLGLIYLKKLDSAKELIAAGSNPIAVRCALDIGENTDMLCVQVQAGGLK